MTGETGLEALLRGMSARLAEGCLVFATLPDRRLPPGLAPLMTFEEAEGTTLILRREAAEAAGLAYVFPCRMITLEVHSALDAVGFIARIATELTRHGIGANPVAGYFHDHLFVPEDRADAALAVLHRLAAEA